MIAKYLLKLGLTEPTIIAKELNGKYIAILRNSGKSGDPKFITVTEETTIQGDEKVTILAAGDILAHENPIQVQEIAERLYPDYAGANNKGGKQIEFCYIRKKLSVL